VRLDLSGVLLADVVLLWFVASVLRGAGLYAFLAGLVALGLALVAFARGRRRPLLALTFVLLLAAATVLSAEALVRLRPGILKGRVATFTLDGYHSERDGIYRPHPQLGRALRPGFARALFWNGHWWRHRANEDGYRGEVAGPGGAAFLGDSMVYGHGLEDAQTLPSRFGAITGRPAANLGQQGTSLVQGWLLLRDRIAILRPRVVFACAHPTDVADALYWYAPEELERFATDDGYVPHVRRERLPASGPGAAWSRRVALPLRTGRLLVALLKPAATANSAPMADGPFVPSAGEQDAPFEPAREPQAQLGWRAHRAALRHLKRTCDGVGARLVVFDLGYPAAFSRAVEESARQAGTGYDPAGRAVLQRALAGQEVYLRRDGHWSPLGADAMARELARAFDGRRQPSP
jgi:hypothetical protein